MFKYSYFFVSFSILLCALSFHKKNKEQSYIYILSSFALICICLFKPFGAGQDDLNYVEIIKTGCTSFKCDDNFLFFRDFIWFFLISIHRHVGEFVSIKIIATAALTVKLILIFKMTSNKLLALTAYASSFYFIHDLTQYRAGLASTFFLLFIFYASLLHRKSSLISILLSIGSHIQALTILLVFLMPKKLSILKYARIICIIFLFLLLLDLGPSIDSIASLSSNILGFNYDPSSDVGKYIHLAQSDHYSFGRISLIAVVISIVLFFLDDFIYNDEKNNNNRTYVKTLSWISVITAYFLYFLFSSVIDVQNRFFEFMIIPIVLIFGNSNVSARNLICLNVFYFSFFFKYHVLQTFFLDYY